MKKLKLALTRDELRALAVTAAHLMKRLPVEQLRGDAALYALVTTWVEVGLWCGQKLTRMEWAAQPECRRALTQAEALAFYALWEADEFGDLPKDGYEASVLNRLAWGIHQHYSLALPTSGRAWLA